MTTVNRITGWLSPLPVYVATCFVLVLSLPLVPANPRILLVSIAAVIGLPLILQGVRSISPYCFSVLVSLAALCTWIAVQTPLAAEEPVFLFGPKEAVGLFATFWMAGIIPGLVVRYAGWGAVRAAMAAVTVIVFVLVLISYLFGIGERHQTGVHVFRAYSYFSDAMDVTVAFFVVWHSVLRNRVLMILAAAALWMMLGKLALGLLMLNIVVLLLLGRDRLRTGAVFAIGAVAIGLAIVYGVSHLRPVINDSDFLESSMDKERPVVDDEVRSCVRRAIEAESFLLRAECAAISAQAYPGSAVVNAGMNTLARRTMGAIAGLDISVERPILGTGYHQSWRMVERMGERNPFGLNDHFTRPEVMWHRVSQIRNTWMRALAEFGLPGLVLLVAFGLSVLLVAARVLFAYRVSPGDVSLEATIGAVWVGVFVVAAQTNPWLLPGSVATAWLGITIGVMMGGLVNPAETDGVSEPRVA